MEEFDKRFMYHVLDSVVPFPVVLSSVGIEVEEGSIFCPFHDDTGHKSAKLFRNKDGDRIWCFAEQKMYAPSHVFKTGMTRLSLSSVFHRVWSRLPDSKKEELQNTSGQQKSFVPEGIERNRERLKLFSKGELSYKHFLDVVMESLQDK